MSGAFVPHLIATYKQNLLQLTRHGGHHGFHLCHQHDEDQRPLGNFVKQIPKDQFENWRSFGQMREPDIRTLCSVRHSGHAVRFRRVDGQCLPKIRSWPYRNDPWGTDPRQLVAVTTSFVL